MSFSPIFSTSFQRSTGGAKRVLEIGSGVGTDARKIIDEGAVYTGINVDLGSTEATSQALRVFSLPGIALQSDATSLDYPDSTFDVVYSFGVLHHIPEAGKAVAEIHRVLKPGGELLVMLYNRASINYVVEIMFIRKLGLRILSLPVVDGKTAAPILGNLPAHVECEVEQIVDRRAVRIERRKTQINS